jgi:very-short-patch-repair endonuclease
MSYPNIREEELKIRVGDDYFSSFDKAKIIGNVDFCVSIRTTNQTKALIEDTESQSFLWAEAKKGKSNIYHSLVQLILTIGKARTFDKELPPAFLGAFDAYQIAFVPYNQIQEIFYKNDFNWTVTPSNYETKEFKQIYELVTKGLTSNSPLEGWQSQTDGVVSNSQTKLTHHQNNSNKVGAVLSKVLIFNFETDSKELKDFIKSNFVLGLKQTNQIQVDKNNFISIYNKWLQKVKPSLIVNWELAKKANIIDGDFYLADLLSEQNQSLSEKLYVLLKGNHYELDKKLDDSGFFQYKQTNFSDNQTAHTQFWNRYKRPPKKEYWDYLVERRDLLVPQDVRERKGSFFTPQIWVEKSQEYLTDVLGENWQDEYYIWDCAAGTGNLLAGLTNKYNIYASTLDKQDVDVMHQRIDTMNQNSVSGNGANLLQDHVFQFDFLNDSFDDPKVPESLQKILKDPEKRKKLVIYINPPYAEASNRDTVVGKGENKSEVATQTKTYQEFQDITGTAARELFAQFFLRIYKDIPDSKLSSFSTLKHINSQNFLKFRQYFKADFKKGFVVPADTFDNVKGKFPIGFLIWDLGKKESIKNIKVDVFDYSENFLQTKLFSSYEKGRFVIDWLRKHYDKKNERIAYLRMQGTDMQNNRGCFFTDSPSKNDVVKHLTANITKTNLIPMSVYLSVRHVFEATWLNDRDQFLYPNDGWKDDTEFQNDCLAFALFHGQNKISSGQGVNNWIPFAENEVNSREKFESNFMVEFMKGKLGKEIPLVEGWQSQTDGVEPNSQTKSTSPAIAGTPQRGESLIPNFPLDVLNNSATYNPPLEGWTAKQDGVDSTPTWQQNSLFPFWNLPKNKELEPNAKKLRKAGVLSEVLFWQAFNNKKLLGFDIDRQVIIGNYIVDFFIPEIGLVVEIDGESHDFKGEYDEQREFYLQSLGLEIIHYKDVEIKKSMDLVSDSFLVMIKKRVEWLKQNPPRQPSVATPQEGNFSVTSNQVASIELFDSVEANFIPTKPLQFSPEATAVFDAGRELWRYYHQVAQNSKFPSLRGAEGGVDLKYNPNASLYDIREYFQGRNEAGKMNNKSTDEEYSKMIANLRDKLKLLAVKIQPKVYDYGFLRG